MSERPNFTKVIAMLTSIDEDNSGGESEIEEGEMLDWELRSSDEMSDDEEIEEFVDAQPIVHLDDLQTADTNVETHSATCFDDDSGSGATEIRAHTRQQQMAQNGNLWNSM